MTAQHASFGHRGCGAGHASKSGRKGARRDRASGFRWNLSSAGRRPWLRAGPRPPTPRSRNGQSGIPLATPPHELHAKPPSEVELFTAGAPRRAFVEVGMIEVQQERYNSAAAGEMVAKLREAGGAAGCDGVVVTGGNDGVAGDKYGSWSLKGDRGTCIVYTTAAAGPTSP